MNLHWEERRKAQILHLIKEDVVFFNANKDGELIMLINTNDILAWGAADCIVLELKDLDDVYSYYRKSKSFGIAVWYCKKVNMMPQEYLYNLIQSDGTFNLDEYNLDINPLWNK